MSLYLRIATLICSKLTSEKAHLLQAKNSLAADLEKLLKHREVSIFVFPVCISGVKVFSYLMLGAYD